jgi:hypothetical protein
VSERIIAIIRDRGPWRTIGQPLVEALDVREWREKGFASPTAWLDYVAARSSRSNTYLARINSATRFLQKLIANNPSLNLSPIWDRTLSDIESFRRETSGNDAKVLERLPGLLSGQLNSYSLRGSGKKPNAPPSKSDRMWLEKTVLDGLAELLPVMGYPKNTEILIEPRTLIGRPDIVLVEPETGATTIIEVKSHLSRRRQDDITQQLIAYASLGQKVWLILPADSEFPGQAVIDHLKAAAVSNVGLLLLDPSTGKAAEIFPPEAEAAADASRTAFKGLLQTAQRRGS